MKRVFMRDRGRVFVKRGRGGACLRGKPRRTRRSDFRGGAETDFLEFALLPCIGEDVIWAIRALNSSSY